MAVLDDFESFFRSRDIKYSVETTKSGDKYLEVLERLSKCDKVARMIFAENGDKVNCYIFDLLSVSNKDVWPKCYEILNEMNRAWSLPKAYIDDDGDMSLEITVDKTIQGNAPVDPSEFFAWVVSAIRDYSEKYYPQFMRAQWA